MPDPTELITFLRSLRSLRAVREFRPEPVPDDVVADMLEVARWSGSSMNRQPWELVVVRRGETLDALAQGSRDAQHLAAAPLGIILVMAGNDVEDEPYDEGRLSERSMLAAAAHGVGSGIGWLRPGEETAKSLLGVPAARTVHTAISLGYPAPTAPQERPRHSEARKALAEIVHDEEGSRQVPERSREFIWRMACWHRHERPVLSFP